MNSSVADGSVELVDVAIDALVERYLLTDEDARDMLGMCAQVAAMSVIDAASWLVYDGEGRYYPERAADPGLRGAAR